MYKKLLKNPVDLADVREWSPMVAQSLQALLDYDSDDFEEVFDLKFVMTRDMYGVAQTIGLKPNGENISVTQQNK